MDDGLRLVLEHRALEAPRVEHVASDADQAGRPRGSRTLAAAEGDDGVAVSKQASDDRAAHEARGAGDEDAHPPSLAPA